MIRGVRMDEFIGKNTQKKLTINDIAKELGLSKTTISRAISGKGRISESTRQRVNDYIKEYKYRPNVIAKSLAKSKTYNIGVVLPSESNLTEIPFFQGCLIGVCEISSELDYDVVVTLIKEDDISLLEKMIENHKVDGVVLTRALENDLSVKFLKEREIPFVLIGSNTNDEVIQVDSNHIAGCTELTSVLLMSGYSRLAFLCGNMNHIVNKNRYQGFLRGYEKNRFIVDKSIVFLDLKSRVLVDRAVDAIMQKRVDCIVCSDDLICSRVLSRLEQMNYKVPKDIRIASFYNSPLLENHIPSVTSLRIDVKELGITAGKRLIELIESGETLSKTLVNYEILLKKSTS